MGIAMGVATSQYLHPWSPVFMHDHCHDGSKEIDRKNIPLVMNLIEK